MSEIELRIKKGLVQLGVSKAIIIPSAWLEELKWQNEDQLYIELSDGVIKIWKADNDDVK